MKKILFLLPVLALALFLAYCAKENTHSTAGAAAPEVNIEAPAAVNRDGGGHTDPCGELQCNSHCCVRIESSSFIQVCGLASNALTCDDCYTPRTGYEEGVGPFVYCVNPPYLGIPFSIRNPSHAAIDVSVATSGGGCGIWHINPGECVQFNVSSTCVLFSSVAAKWPC